MAGDSTHLPDIVVCLVTTPQGDARSIARAAIEKRLAACVNIVPLVQSLYRWEGSMHENDEALLMIKTTRAATAQLDELLRTIHPYENFELVSLDVGDGSKPYLAWIDSSVSLIDRGSSCR
jgi:periplasmic divalent cation tolerance protein